MNRLQKKCVIATAGIHLLLLLLLVFGSAFFSPRPKPDDTQLLEVIPANLIDAAFNSGVRQAAPPPPAPAIVTPPIPVVQPAPQPPAPKPVVTPPPTLMDRVEKYFKPEPKSEPVKPAPEKTETQPHKIQINTQLVQRTAPKITTPNTKPDSSRDNAKAISNAIRNLQKNLSPGTTIAMPGDSTVAYANYASVVKSVYDAAWTLPDTIVKDENITAKVTIASDGTVISARIIERSGDEPADASVQRTLDRVTTIGRPFPEGSTDKERIYTIVFNPQVKNSE